MRTGKKVKFKITSYPYERTGVIIGHEKRINIIKVQYKKKFMIFKKKDNEINECE